MAFDSSEKKRAATELMDLKQGLLIKNNNPPLINHYIFEKYAAAFSEHKSFSKIQQGLLERIKLQPDFIDELEHNDPRILLLLSKDMPDELMPAPHVVVKIVIKIFIDPLEET